MPINTTTTDNEKLIEAVSDSSNVSARTLVEIKNDNTAAVGATCLSVTNDAIASTAGQSVLIESTAAETFPLLRLRNSNAATDKPAILELQRSDTSAESDGMDLGKIQWTGVDNANNATTYASILAEAGAVASGSEEGKMTIGLATTSSGAHETVLTLEGGSSAVLSQVTAAGFVSALKFTANTFAGTADTDMTIASDGNMTFRIDGDNDETGQSFAFQNNASTEIANLNESGDLQIDGDLTVSGGDASLVADGATLKFGASSDIVLTHDTDRGLILTQATETTAEPIFTIKNTGDLASGGGIEFVLDNGAGEGDDDILGYINFKGDNSNNDSELYAKIEAISSDITENDEGGKFKFSVMAGGIAGTAAMAEVLSLGGEDQANSTNCEVVINEPGNAFVDFRVESDDETHMLFVDAGNNRVSIGDSVDAPTATLEVTNNASAGAFDVPLVQLNSNDVNQVALDINAANTSQNVIDIAATALTGGKVINIATGNSQTTTTAMEAIALDLDKSGVVGSGVSSTFKGIKLDIDDSATNHGSSTVAITGIEIDIDSASNQGSNSNIGIDINVIDATVNNGIQITAEDGAGSDVKFMSSADSGDYFSIATGANGATTITTVDDDAAAANLTFDIDGAVTLNTATTTIGQGTTADVTLAFNGNGSGAGAQDFYVGVDYSYNSNNGGFFIGSGATPGQNTAIQLHNGRLGFIQPDDTVTPSAISIEQGKHLIVGTLGPDSPHDANLPADNGDNTVIQGPLKDSAGQAFAIPVGAIITKVVVVTLQPSNLGTHNANLIMASDSSASADAGLSNTQEILGAGVAETRSTDSTGSTVDIDLKQDKEVFIVDGKLQVQSHSAVRYVYLCNAGTGNGTANSSTGKVAVYIEYYGVA